MSSLWAGWADAVGFITELADERLVNKRLNGRPLIEPIQWERRVGGRSGVNAVLPAGTYSDDTQLRLATGRAISGYGFDVDAFARIELTVWPTYALGGGRATKAAAGSFGKKNRPWFANFFDGWVEAGGNGVAMRIQPHVWSAPGSDDLGSYLVDVVTNGVTTHGHPRALVGAVLHAVALRRTLITGSVPMPDVWSELLEIAADVVTLLDESDQITSVWRPAWERTVGKSFSSAWQETITECEEMLASSRRMVDALHGNVTAPSRTARKAYEDLAAVLRLADPARRGSATSTAVAALALAATFPDGPANCALLAAHALGTDTDTIATMAAALAGAGSAASRRPGPVLDASYLASEGARLAHIAVGLPTETFSYPDLIGWVPPHSQLDSVGFVNGKPALAGIGWITPVKASETFSSRGAQWQWMKSDFGASFLVKHRAQLRPLPESMWPERRGVIVEPAKLPLTRDTKTPQLPFPQAAPQSGAPVNRGPNRDGRNAAVGQPLLSDVQRALEWVAEHDYSDEAIGRALRKLNRDVEVEQLVVFTVLLRASLNASRGQPDHS